MEYKQNDADFLDDAIEKAVKTIITETKRKVTYEEEIIIRKAVMRGVQVGLLQGKMLAIQVIRGT